MYFNDYILALMVGDSNCSAPTYSSTGRSRPKRASSLCETVQRSNTFVAFAQRGDQNFPNRFEIQSACLSHLFEVRPVPRTVEECSQDPDEFDLIRRFSTG